MKKRFYSFIVLCFCMGAFACAQDTEDGVVQKTIVAIQNSDATEWLSQASPRLWVHTPKENNTYSKQQAEMIMRSFFQQNHVQNFSPKVSRNNNEILIVGEIATIEGKKFHLAYKLRNEKNKFHMIEISINER